MNIAVPTLREFFNQREGKRITVILDTGVLLADDLDTFFESLPKNVKVRIPWDCWMEIDFLRKYGNLDGIRKKAENILSLYGTGCWEASPAVTNMLANPEGLFGYFNTEVILFVFCEPLAAEAVSRRIGDVENMHYIVISPFDMFPLCPEYSMEEHYVMPCRPFVFAGDFNVMENSVYSVDGYGKIKGSDLTEENNGGEATLYSCSKLPGRLIKIFNRMPNHIMVQKLEFLSNCSNMFKNCVLPEGLVYRNGECVGYIMKKVTGETMLQFKNRGPNENERLDMIRNLFVLLTEMRIRSFLVTDLSNGNVFVENGRPVLIDCDSMQCCHYPGGGVTFPFGHPGVTPDFNYLKMRSNEHFNYSVAVMLWQLLLEWDNPYTQNGRDCQTCSSVDSAFPFTVSGMVDGITTREDKLERWQSLPKALREAFCKTFNMEKSYSIGEWFELLQKSYENFEKQE